LTKIAPKPRLLQQKNIGSRKMVAADGSGEDEDEEMNPQGDGEDADYFNRSFKPTKYIFDNILDNRNVVTKFPIVSISLMSNSKSVVAVTKPSIKKSRIRQFDINTGENMFNDEIDGTFVKVSEIVINPFQTDFFACPYNDNGRFNIRLYDLDSFNKKTIDLNDLL
jgi:hypothetical protein